MFPDWIGLHGSQIVRLTKCWWWSMQLKRRGIRQWSKSRTECINVSPASLCILTESFREGYSMGRECAVACDYRLINRCIAGAMKLLARHLNFSRVTANSGRMLLTSALPQGQVLICEKDYHKVQIMMKTIIDGSRCGMDITLKCTSEEQQRFVVL